MGRVIRPDKFATADAYFTLPGFDLMVLHPSRFIRCGTENPFAMNGNRRGDVAHKKYQ